MCVLIYNIYLKLLILNKFKIMLIYLKLLLAYIKAIYPLLKIQSISQWASPVTQMLKNLPAVQETWIRYLGQEDPLDKEMATHSIPGESHGQRSLASFSPWGHTDRHDWLTLTFSSSGSRSDSQNIKHLVWYKRGWNRTDNQSIRVDASYTLPIEFQPCL